MLPFYVKIQLFYTNFCEKRSFVPFLSCLLTNPFIERTVFYNMVRILLKYSFRGLLKLYVIRHQLILGDPGAVSRVDKMFVVKVFCTIETSPWALTLTEPVPEASLPAFFSSSAGLVHAPVPTL